MSRSPSIPFIFRVFEQNPCLTPVFDVDWLISFLHIVQLLKLTLRLYTRSDDKKPNEHLPVNIHKFLKVSPKLDDCEAKLAWESLCCVAWEMELTEEDLWSIGRRYLQLFLDHGISRGVAFYYLGPPTHVCLDSACLQKSCTSYNAQLLWEQELVESLTFPVTIFMQDFGPIPGFATSMYCRHVYVFLIHQTVQLIQGLWRLQDSILC